jgi:multiple sugar transport system ATP-binding protein
MPHVAFEKIVKSFGAITVLQDLDLEVGDGEFLVLLGPSGCGKTTLLNLLAGLLDLTSGRIMIGDRDVTELDPKDRGLAMVFQSYALYPTKTVRGNLAFGLSASKLSKSEIEQRIAWASAMLQIGPLLDRKPGQLSGGQRQRVAIGRALVKKVGVFLFDEPLSNLDAKLRTETRLEIKRLHDELKSTVVYVTHDQIEAMTMATKVAVMNAGVIQQFGTPDDIYERPANLFVAAFIGAPAMNLRSAVLEVSGGSIAARLGDDIKVDLAGYPFVAQPVDGTDVMIGFRPEHFGRPNQTFADAATQFALPIQYTEKTGGDATAYLKIDGGLLAVRVHPDEISQLKQGDIVTIGFPRGRMHVFDAKQQHRL